MVTMKFGKETLAGVDVNKTSGFEPYEGPLPRPGVYAAEIRSVKMRVSQAGNPYINVMYELTDQKSADKQQFKGAPIWDRVVPGDSDIQKERVAKFLATVSGKDPSKVNINVDHEEITAGGKVNKVGGKDPVGVKVRLTIQRSTNNGEAIAEARDLFPWPKDEEFPTGPEAAEDDDVEVEEDETEEPDEAEDEVEESDESDETDDEEEDDSDEEEDDEVEDDEVEEDEDDGAFEARQAELREMTRVQLKAALKAVDPAATVRKSESDEDIANRVIDLEFPVDGEADSEEPPF